MPRWKGDPKITPLQLYAIDAAYKGYSNAQIAEAMGVGVPAVCKYYRRVCKKFNLGEPPKFNYNAWKKLWRANGEVPLGEEPINQFYRNTAVQAYAEGRLNWD